jgi:hypothetical protein
LHPISLDNRKLTASYQAMIRNDITKEQRQALWELAKEQFPEMARVIREQLQNARVEDDVPQQERLAGATFFFLTVINALAEKPVVVALETPRPATKNPASFPTFGILKRLGPTQET